MVVSITQKSIEQYYVLLTLATSSNQRGDKVMLAVEIYSKLFVDFSIFIRLFHRLVFNTSSESVDYNTGEIDNNDWMNEIVSTRKWWKQ